MRWFEACVRMGARNMRACEGYMEPSSFMNLSRASTTADNPGQRTKSSMGWTGRGMPWSNCCCVCRHLGMPLVHGKQHHLQHAADQLLWHC